MIKEKSLKLVDATAWLTMQVVVWAIYTLAGYAVLNLILPMAIPSITFPQFSLYQSFLLMVSIRFLINVLSADLTIDKTEGKVGIKWKLS